MFNYWFNIELNEIIVVRISGRKQIFDISTHASEGVGGVCTPEKLKFFSFSQQKKQILPTFYAFSERFLVKISIYTPP
jgi:hypothetical protein